MIAVKASQMRAEGKSIDIIVVLHMEPDHSGSLIDIVKKYPDIKIYTSMAALETEYQEISRIRSSETAGKRIYTEINARMNELRSCIDRYEIFASREFYKLPSYEDMLFSL